MSDRYVFDVDADMYYDNVVGIYIDVSDELSRLNKELETAYSKTYRAECPQCGTTEFLCGHNKRD